MGVFLRISQQAFLLYSSKNVSPININFLKTLFSLCFVYIRSIVCCCCLYCTCAPPCVCSSVCVCVCFFFSKVAGCLMPTRTIGDLDCKRALGAIVSPHPELTLAAIYAPPDGTCFFSHLVLVFSICGVGCRQQQSHRRRCQRRWGGGRGGVIMSGVIVSIWASRGGGGGRGGSDGGGGPGGG